MNPEKPGVQNLTQQKEVAAFAKEQFAFLKTEKGFSRPLVHRPGQGLLIYRNATMGIGVEMHFSSLGYYYDFMKVTLGKFDKDGHFSRFAYRDEQHVRSFWVLESFLIRQLHTQSKHLLTLDQYLQDHRKKGSTWNIEQWKQVISLYRALLLEHIDLILQQPCEILFPTAIEYLRVDQTEFAQLTHNNFAFLQEYGFRINPIVEDYGTSYTWISAECGIELTLDLRDGIIDCSIIKLIDGKLPTYKKSDLKRTEYIQGKRDSISLSAFLSKQLNIADPDIGRISNIASILTINDCSDYDYAYASTIISIYATLVRRYLPQLLKAQQL